MKILLKTLLFPFIIIQVILSVIFVLVVIIVKFIWKMLDEAGDFLTSNEIPGKLIHRRVAEWLVILELARIGDFVGYKTLRPKFLLKHVERISFYALYKQQEMPLAFISAFVKKYKPKDWEAISLYQDLTEEFIMKNIKELNRGYLLVNENLKKTLKDNEGLELFIRLQD